MVWPLLTGLRLCVAPGEATPALYDSPLYQRAKHWNVSTSALESAYFDNWGWGEVVDDGFGVAYSAKPASLHFNVVSAGLGSRRFVAALRSALEAMRRIAETQQQQQQPRSKL